MQGDPLQPHAQGTSASLDVSNLSESFDSTQFYIHLVKESFMTQYATQFPHPSHAQIELGFHKVIWTVSKLNFVLSLVLNSLFTVNWIYTWLSRFVSVFVALGAVFETQIQLSWTSCKRKIYKKKHLDDGPHIC